MINRVERCLHRIKLFFLSKTNRLVFFSTSISNINKIYDGVSFVKISNEEEFKIFKKKNQLSFEINNENINRFHRGSKLYLLMKNSDLLSSGWLAYKEKFWFGEIDSLIDMKHSNAAVLYDFKTTPQHRGKGYYAVLLNEIVLDFGEADEYYGYALESNTASIKGMEKANFRFEGRYQKKDFFNFSKRNKWILLGNRYRFLGLKYRKY